MIMKQLKLQFFLPKANMQELSFICLVVFTGKQIQWVTSMLVTDVRDEIYWRGNMLVTTIRCWWRLWPIWSLRSTSFYITASITVTNIPMSPKTLSPIHRIGEYNLSTFSDTLNINGWCFLILYVCHFLLLYILYLFYLNLVYFSRLRMKETDSQNVDSQNKLYLQVVNSNAWTGYITSIHVHVCKLHGFIDRFNNQHIYKTSNCWFGLNGRFLT